MPKKTNNVGRLGELKHLTTSIEANRQDLSHVEVTWSTLVDVVTRAEVLVKQQAAFTASKQQTSQELRGLLIEGERLATILRLAIKQRYGIRSEKLAEYRMQPFRGLKRNGKPEPEGPKEPEAPTPSQSTPTDSAK